MYIRLRTYSRIYYEIFFLVIIELKLGAGVKSLVPFEHFDGVRK